VDVLIVVDMQNDFVSGALGTKEAVEIVPYVVSRVTEGMNRGEKILFTRDTHETDYPETQEGRNLPVPHCVRGTDGWEIIPQLTEYTKGCTIVDKPTFGSVDLPRILADYGDVDEVTLCGLCTDICVISNAMLVKAAFPEATVTVDGTCSAGVSEESHRTALQAMRAVQIEVVE